MIKLNMIAAIESDNYAHPAVISRSNEIDVGLANSAH